MKESKQPPSDEGSEESAFLMSNEPDESELADSKIEYNTARLRKEARLTRDERRALSLDTQEGLRKLRVDLRQSLVTLMRLSRGMHRSKQPLAQGAPEQAKKTRANELATVQEVIETVKDLEVENEQRTSRRYQARLAPKLAKIFKLPFERRETEIKALLEYYSIPLDYAPIGQKRTSQEGLDLLLWTDEEIARREASPHHAAAHAARQALAEFLFGGTQRTIYNHENEHDFLPLPSTRKYHGPFFFRSQANVADTLVHVLHQLFGWEESQTDAARKIHRTGHPQRDAKMPQSKVSPKHRTQTPRRSDGEGPQGHGRGRAK